MASPEQATGPAHYGGLDEIAVPAPAAPEQSDSKRSPTKKSARASFLPIRGLSSKAKAVDPSKPSASSRQPLGAAPAPSRRSLAPTRRTTAPDPQASTDPTSTAADATASSPPAGRLEEKREASAGGTRSQSPAPDTRAFDKNKDTSGYEVWGVATKIYTVGYLTLFSILGVLARLGLIALTQYPNAPVQQGLVWANFTGSFVMGFLAEDRQLFKHEWGQPPIRGKPDGGDSDAAAEKRRHGAVKKTLPLFIGLATGFCGSLTSFSSFQRDVFLVLANSAPSPETDRVLHRNGGYSFLGVLAELILTPALSLAALQAGAHLALALDRWMPSLDFYFVRGFFDPVASFVGFAAWLGAVLMAIWPPDRPHGPAAYYHETWAHETWRGQAIFACVFAPLGTLVRFYVSMVLNPRVATFPLGTFAVNMFGTLMEGILYDLQHAKIPIAGFRVGGGRVGCQVLQGLQDGFCGCVTTVSTWVAELKGLRRAHAYVYGLVSLAVGVGLMVIIMGSLRWTQGFYAMQCVT